MLNMDINKNADQREKKLKAAVFLLFAVYFILGLFLFDDYGCGPDEGMERQTSLVNYRYVLEKLNLPVDERNAVWMAYLPELKEYRDRYYGTALHTPVVLIEAAFHFTLEPSQFYGMRHFYTFLNFFLGVICFYRLLSKRFGNRLWGLLGAGMLILTPRFFAESFYNNKDVIFTAWYIITTYCMVRWFEKKELKRTVLLAAVLALSCNTRFNAIVFLPIFGVLFVFDWITNRQITPKTWLYFGLVFALFLLFFYLITPNFWDDPFGTLIETLQFNLHHPNHGSDGNLFKGVLVDAAQTLTFIPTWMLITIPTVFLVFSLLGTVSWVIVTVRNVLRGKFEAVSAVDMSFFISGFMAAGYIIVRHVTIYNGWRHCYFCYPCVLFFAVYCLASLKHSVTRKVSIALVGLCMLYNIGWIAANHPYEYVYFAPLFRNKASEFSGDYWGISSRALFEYIVESDPERMLLINHAHSQAGSINRGLLPEEQRMYLELTYEDTGTPDYYIVCRDDVPSTDLGITGYEKVYAITVDNDEIGAAYKRK